MIVRKQDFPGLPERLLANPRYYETVRQHFLEGSPRCNPDHRHYDPAVRHQYEHAKDPIDWNFRNCKFVLYDKTAEYARYIKEQRREPPMRIDDEPGALELAEREMDAQFEIEAQNQMIKWHAAQDAAEKRRQENTRGLMLALTDARKRPRE